VIHALSIAADESIADEEARFQSLIARELRRIRLDQVIRAERLAKIRFRVFHELPEFTERLLTDPGAPQDPKLRQALLENAAGALACVYDEDSGLDPRIQKAFVGRLNGRALGMLESPDPQARRIASHYLKEVAVRSRTLRVDSPSAQEKLIRAARDPDPQVRLNVAIALVAKRKQLPRNTIDALFQVLADPVLAVRSEVIDVLSREFSVSSLSDGDFTKLVATVWPMLAKLPPVKARTFFSRLGADPRIHEALKSVDPRLEMLERLARSSDHGLRTTAKTILHPEPPHCIAPGLNALH
jgi:hypothetical protein